MIYVTMLCLFFFNDTATTEIYTLSLHDALPISWTGRERARKRAPLEEWVDRRRPSPQRATNESSTGTWTPGRGADRKSTRLNSSHANISYAVFCLKKKINHNRIYNIRYNYYHTS